MEKSALLELNQKLRRELGEALLERYFHQLKTPTDEISLFSTDQIQYDGDEFTFSNDPQNSLYFPSEEKNAFYLIYLENF